jgi:hypothetical protein
MASHSDTTESLERNIPLVIFFSKYLTQLTHHIAHHTKSTQHDDLVSSLSLAFNCVLAMLIQGHPLDHNLSM